MTPAQLRAYSAVFRLETRYGRPRGTRLLRRRVSMHVAALRRTRPLFTRTGAGLALPSGAAVPRGRESWAYRQAAIGSPKCITGVGCCASQPFCFAGTPRRVRSSSSRQADDTRSSWYPWFRRQSARAPSHRDRPKPVSSIGSDGSIPSTYQSSRANQPLAAGIPMPALLRLLWMLVRRHGSVGSGIATMLRGLAFGPAATRAAAEGHVGAPRPATTGRRDAAPPGGLVRDR